MYIHEAVAISSQTGRPFALYDKWRMARIVHLWPTDTAAGVVMYCKIGDRSEKLQTRWNPSASDLMSDKWFIVPAVELFSAEKVELAQRAEQSRAQQRDRWWSKYKAALRHRLK